MQKKGNKWKRKEISMMGTETHYQCGFYSILKNETLIFTEKALHWKNIFQNQQEMLVKHNHLKINKIHKIKIDLKWI